MSPMRKTLPVVTAGAILLGISSYASAALIGGLDVPDGSIFSVAQVYENVVTGVGQTLSGYGEVDSINGMAVSTLCSGCAKNASATALLGALLLLCWLAPNTQQITRYHGPSHTDIAPVAQDVVLRWRPTSAWAAAIACLFALSLMNLSKVSEFLYFQF